MKYNPEIHKRQSIRLKGYDYSQAGLYFITICTQNRECLLGSIVGAGSKPALFNPAQNIAYSPNIKNIRAGLEPVNKRAGLEPAPTQTIANIAYIRSVQVEIQLNEYGVIVENTWNDLTNHIPNIVLDEFVIMPNHVHGIIQIVNPGLKRAGLSEIIRQFKTFSAKRINVLRKSPGISVWQRNYHEHIIRNENELNLIREYVINNPLNWDSDRNNPTCKNKDTDEELNFIIN